MGLYEQIKESFDKQGLMHSLNAHLASVQDGEVKVACEFSAGVTQQDGYFHGGAITSILDSACGYAAWTKIPEGKEVLTVEFKVNFIKAAKANKIVAVGKVIHAGKTLMFCEGEVFDETETTVLAKMSTTMIVIAKSV
ncbi:PaaI family thioesterase [Polluticoccus soli]|uniref:PaaI family thioesterase n=1 Tax=Polluticoccus soli TaxID=3034150 RepID=UPI0023E19EAB|nr:PaaI family thioesterase [Flavipsychrobacter sp. JY13-12]